MCEQAYYRVGQGYATPEKVLGLTLVMSDDGAYSLLKLQSTEAEVYWRKVEI